MKIPETSKAERRVGARLLGGFQKFARTVTRTSGHPMAFGLAIGIIVIWALTGPFFDYGTTWLLVSRHGEGAPATTEGRAIDHLAFVVKDIDTAAAQLRRQRVTFLEGPAVPRGGRTAARLDEPARFPTIGQWTSSRR